MRDLIQSLIFLLWTVSITAQNGFIETQPELIGGSENLRKLIVYPESARYAGVEGDVIVKLIVSSSGDFSGIEVLKSLSEDCDSVVVQAIKSIRFKPAKRNGYSVKAVVIIPVLFKLR